MKSNNTFILQLYVKKCRINVQQSGTVGLLLRAGKNQSHVTTPQRIINGVIDFNTKVKINIDQSTLDTKRCSLTLNFTSDQNAKRVIGIVVVNLPDVGEEIQKSFKITSTPDKEAQIELNVAVNQLLDNVQPAKEQMKSPEKTSSQLKNSQKPKQPTRNAGFLGQLVDSLAKKPQQTPLSPPSELTQQKLNLKSKKSQLLELNSQSQEMQFTIEKLQRQKQLLKELLKHEMAKSLKAYNYLKNIIELLQSLMGVNFGSQDMMSGIRNTVSGQGSGISKKMSSVTDGVDFSKLGLGLSSPGVNLPVVKESKFEDFSPNPEKSKAQYKSKGANQSTPDILTVLNSLKAKVEESGKSKDQMRKILQKIKVQPQVEVDSQKVRILKTRIDRTYVQLLNKEQPSKQQILKQKIQINKILDEVINPVVKS